MRTSPHSRISIPIAVFCIAAGVSTCSLVDSDGTVFALYRNSVRDEIMRMLVATFDAGENEDCNRGNCDIAQTLFQAQPGVQVKFWGEKRRFRK